MKLQLIARHLKDDVDHVLDEVNHHRNMSSLIEQMEDEIRSNKSEGSNWRYSIVPHEDEYK